MKKNWRNNIYILLLLVLAVSAACKTDAHKHSKEKVEYTCPMHPQIVKNQPGPCPICGMDLVLKSNPNSSSANDSAGLSFSLNPTNKTIISTIKTVTPVVKPMEFEVEVSGIISYDTRKTATLPIRIGGRIEKLYVKYNFQEIKKGQKVLEIYSPELVTAQREFIYLLNSDQTNSELIERGKQRLRLLGVTDGQIRKIENDKEPIYSFGIFSPYDGYIFEKSSTNSTNLYQPLQSSSSGMGNMDGSTSANLQTSNSKTSSFDTNPQVSIKEGMYVNAGQPLFTIINTKQVWAEFNLNPKEGELVKKGTPINITSSGTELKYEGKINMIQPFYTQGEYFIKARVYLSSSLKNARVGQLITGVIPVKTNESEWLPSSSILNLGNQTIAFVKKDEIFKPVNVIVGRKAGNWVELISGLEKTSEVALNAQFMVDSESFIKVEN